MKNFLFVTSLFAVLFFSNSLLCAAEVREVVFIQPFPLPGDSILIKDTIRIDSRTAVVTNTLKITDTTSRPIVVNGQWLKKRITVTEYVALPSDTILLAQAHALPEQPVVKANNNLPPDAKQTVEAVSSDNNSNKVTAQTNTETIPSPSLNAETPAHEADVAPVVRPAGNKAEEEEEKVLLPTRLAKSEKPGKKGKKTEQTTKTEPVTAIPLPPKTEETAVITEQTDIKTKPETTLQSLVVAPENTAPNTQAVPAPAVNSPAPDDEFIDNVSIEIIDEVKVIGVRTDLPDDNLPPGGILLIDLFQPQPENANPAKEKTPAKEDNKHHPPIKDVKPNADTTITEQPLQPIQLLPVAADNNSAPVISSPDRIILESKVITLGEAYKLTLEDVKKQHDIYAKAYKKAKTDEEANGILWQAGRYLEDIIANDIVYYWYGTGFDKEGTAANPGSGRIACSYFVATMLTEAGLNIDRIKLAQQSAQGIIKTLSTPEHLTRCVSPGEVEALIMQKGKGLYFIGFSYHVGFLYYNGSEIDLIHASPLPPGTVSRISMKTARSFDYSNFFDIGKLTENKELIANWLTGKKMPIIP